MKHRISFFIHTIHVILVIMLLLGSTVPAFAGNRNEFEVHDIHNSSDNDEGSFVGLSKQYIFIGTIEVSINDTRIPAISDDKGMPDIQALNEALDIKFIPSSEFEISSLDIRELRDIMPQIKITGCSAQKSISETIKEYISFWGWFCHFWWPYRRIWYGWRYSPYPDMDYFMYYRVPRHHKREVCITAYLALALWATHRKLYIRVYWHNRWTRYDVYEVNIGHSVVRNLCLRLTGHSNCANWLLNRQAVVRYKR